MAKIVLIGAGSHIFSTHLITDFVSYPELRDSTITLMDIDKKPLDIITAFAQKLVKQHSFNTKIESSMNRREALADADYVIVTIQVGGARKVSEDIAEKFGLPKNWAGPGIGGLRQIPVILDICQDMEDLCPDAWLLEYTNPVPTICWAVNDYTSIKNVGLCHSVPHTAAELAKYMGAPLEEISYWVAGLNHMAWFLELKWNGEDAYPLLREKFTDPAIYSGPDAHWAGPDIVRAEIFKAFGYYVTEASHIVSYSLPYFRKKNQPEVLEKFKLETHNHPERHPKSFEELEKMKRRQDEELKKRINSNQEIPISHSGEYASTIIHSIETGIPSRVNGNVKNNGLITNLSKGCCVEVPCLVDKKGISPCYVGNLPPQLAALNQSNVGAQELAVRGIVEKDKTKIFQASLLDPLTSAILTIDETRQMLDELFEAEKKYLKGFK
jgi:alpha-galactosidase